MSLVLNPGSVLPKDMDSRQWSSWCKQDAFVESITTVNINDNAVTLAKIQQIATDTLLGRSTAGTGNVETIACTSAGRALLDDVNAAAQRSTLGLGTAATQNTGTSGANVPLLNGSNVHASAQCTLFAVGSASPVGSQAANADTSGATLGQLETSVNQIKAALRAFGLIET